MNGNGNDVHIDETEDHYFGDPGPTPHTATDPLSDAATAAAEEEIIIDAPEGVDPETGEIAAPINVDPLPTWNEMWRQVLEGNVIEGYVYSFEQGKRVVNDLTLKAIGDIATWMGISVATDSVERTPEGWAVVAKATLITPRGVQTRIGAAFAPAVLRGNNDDYAINKAVSKAQRNAQKAFIPEALRLRMIAAHKSPAWFKEQQAKLQTDQPAAETQTESPRQEREPGEEG